MCKQIIFGQITTKIQFKAANIGRCNAIKTFMAHFNYLNSQGGDFLIIKLSEFLFVLLRNLTLNIEATLIWGFGLKSSSSKRTKTMRKCINYDHRGECKQKEEKIFEYCLSKWLSSKRVSLKVNWIIKYMTNATYFPTVGLQEQPKHMTTCVIDYFFMRAIGIWKKLWAQLRSRHILWKFRLRAS